MIWTAFILGIAGSLHCIGMCGPIALMLPAGKSSSDQLFKAIVYNLGRVLTYGLLGLAFGFFGKGLFIAGWQQWVSIVFGLIVLVGVLYPTWVKRINPSKPLLFNFRKLQSKILPLINRQRSFGLFAAGMINGILPCGLIYVAIAGAILVGTPLKSAIYMMVFGLGTLPALVFIAMTKGLILKRYSLQLKRFLPVFMVMMALVFVLRGLNLGIPYLSPKMEKDCKTECCHK